MCSQQGRDGGALPRPRAVGQAERAQSRGKRGCHQGPGARQTSLEWRRGAQALPSLVPCPRAISTPQREQGSWQRGGCCGRTARHSRCWQP